MVGFLVDKDNMVLRITFKNLLKTTEFILTTALLYVGLMWYFNFDSSIVIGGGIFYLLFTLPALYLHLEYYFKNRGQEVEVNSTGITVRESNGIERDYNKNELDRIIIYKSASLDRGGIQFTAIESYYYARIIAKTGEEIIITCLLTPKVEEAARQLMGIKYERKKRFFCTLLWK